MQDGSWNQPLPISVLPKNPAAGGTLAGDGGVFSEASSDGELYVDSVPEQGLGDGDFADLTAFLTAEEINLSLDLAREAFGEACDCEEADPSSLTQLEQALQFVSSFSVPPKTNEHLHTNTNLQLQTNPLRPDENPAVSVSSSQNLSLNKPVSNEGLSSTEKVTHHKPAQPVYKQDKPRLVHQGLELNDRAASATEFCSRAATFIEELSSIFKSSSHSEQQLEEESSSPDSGYLSPRGQRPVPQGSASAPFLPPGQVGGAHISLTEVGHHPGGPVGQTTPKGHQHSGVPSASGPLSPPQFIQKLKSQEVAEGSPIRLECRVRGNPLPLVR